MKKLIRKIKEIYIVWSANRILKEAEKNEVDINAERSQEEIERSLEMIRKKIQKRELEEEKKRLAEEQELIRLGRRYKKSLQRRKYIFLFAVFVLALAFSINCFGSVDKMFHKLNLKIYNREREVADTDGVIQLEGTSEEEAFAKIEELYGFYPVRLGYLPEGTEFFEMNVYQDIPKMNVLYGNKDNIQIIYDIMPNYRESSISKDIEDSLVNEYKMTHDKTEINVKEYLVDRSETRWLLQFEYGDFYYWIYILDVEENEMIKIVENMYLS